MTTQMIHIPSGRVFKNRKEAKQQMGCNQYKRAINGKEILFLSIYNPSDIIV